MIRLAALLILPSLALATGKPETPQPVATSQSGSIAGAVAGAHSDSRSSAGSWADASGGNATGGESSSVSGANGVVNANDTSQYESKALGVVLPNVAASPAVTGPCLVNTRGHGNVVWTSTGGTKFDRDRCKQIDCFAIADRLASYGQIPAAMTQLKACGGVDVSYIAPPVTAVSTPPAVVVGPDLSQFVTRTEHNASVTELKERQDRQFKRGVSK